MQNIRLFSLALFAYMLGLVSLASAADATNKQPYVNGFWDGGSIANLSWNRLAGGDSNQYRVYLSENSNMATPESAEKNGKILIDWTWGLGKYVVSNLAPGKLYYAAVVAKTPAGQQLSYYRKEICTRSAQSGGPIAEKDPGSALPADWWKTAVFYEIFVRSFQDSDGDGKGDLKGLISRLDYLKELGVGGIWLMPVAESSDDDHGYHVTDYRAIEKDYGALEDYKTLLREAHQRGIGVIVDLVVNHTSAKHPFYLDASTNLSSPYRSWYWFEADKPGVWRIPEGGSDAWSKLPSGWNYAALSSAIPDINYHNLAVREWMEDNLRFWLNLGTDGFRYDAVMHLWENGRGKVVDQPETHRTYQEHRALMDRYANRYSVCENGAPAYFGNGNEFHSAFNFAFCYYAMRALKTGHFDELTANQDDFARHASPSAVYANFLGNHDAAFGTRIFTQFSNSVEKNKLAAGLLLTWPGIPYVYYGEETGMVAQNPKYGDGAMRTPMQWSAETNAGFSTGKPYRRVNTNYAAWNVEAQKKDKNSLWNHYRTLIALRNAHPSLSRGSFIRLNADEGSILAYLREEAGEKALVVLNFSSETLSPTVGMSEPPKKATALFATGGEKAAVSGAGIKIENLPGYGVTVMQVE